MAQAVADAWLRFEDAARKQDAEAGPAREVLASYDPAELAGLCTAVSPHSLMWHAPSVISAWPGQPAVQEFADKLIDDPAPIASGIPDTIPPAILRAYCGRTDETSGKILDKTLSLLKHIEPELREVLVFNSPAARSARTTASKSWRNGDTNPIPRFAASRSSGSSRRSRGTSRPTTPWQAIAPSPQKWNGCARRSGATCAPTAPNSRTPAAGMDRHAHAGGPDAYRRHQETIGDPGAPGVKLEVLYDGDVDQILVDLVADNWDRLRAHFGEAVFERLNGKSDSRRRTASEQRLHVMSALATAAPRHPAIADMLRREADAEPALRQDRHFLLWAKEENRGDEGTLRALARKLGDTTHRWQDTVLDSLLDRESWNVTEEVFKAILTEDAAGGGPARSMQAKS